MVDISRKGTSFNDIVKKIGFPTIFIGGFWILLLIAGGALGISIKTLISDTIKRAGMNGILVLAMVPSIQSGTGPNFALPVGIVCGLFATVLAIEFGFTGWAWLFVSIAFSIPLSVVVGYLYGKLLNAVKGSEMTIATYTGFSIVAAMCLAWLMIPFKSPNMGWFIGNGLRETIQLDVIGGDKILSNFLSFSLFGENGLITVGGEKGIIIPTGMLIIFFLCCFIVWIYFRSKSGIAISAGGINPKFAQSSGIDIDKCRIKANILSTIMGAIGIIVYSQGYGYTQLYTAPLMMAFPAVAAVLIGGASAQRAKVSHVIIGVIIYQGLFTTALPVANQLFEGMDLSEILRMVIQNGIILYALTQVKGGDN
ncbi:MAG: ABC transporter permease [Tissierellia bacterium]|jgi:simple sugar transport system permease protein|nr:ABC transporter permease [Tissierellia bacterium]MDD3226986.1 ABC transporter permease [Tissierellia bacterium]MDD3751072.1 ABC transporter permease [Tissierellia bacterium]MDD4046364.1 ABC transporter permease [Tissierellia bacterium]MDD4678299.1 ABC transporter permease [Tissierellia bacterium]